MTVSVSRSIWISVRNARSILAVFLQKTDEVAIADHYWGALKPFLEDCRKELV